VCFEGWFGAWCCGSLALTTGMPRILARMGRLVRGYEITPRVLAVGQAGGWIELPLEQVAVVKHVSVSRVIVRFFCGRRYVLDLFGFALAGHDRVVAALREAAERNRAIRISHRSVTERAGTAPLPSAAGALAWPARGLASGCDRSSPVALSCQEAPGPALDYCPSPGPPASMWVLT
jgi:hypothetical protein